MKPSNLQKIKPSNVGQPPQNSEQSFILRYYSNYQTFKPFKLSNLQTFQTFKPFKHSDVQVALPKELPPTAAGASRATPTCREALGLGNFKNGFGGR